MINKIRDITNMSQEKIEMAKKKKVVVQNKNAVIRTRTDKNGNSRTETVRRDGGTVTVAVSTNPRNDSTRLFINTPEGNHFKFDGRTARTLYRALQKHYQATDKNW